MVLAEFAHVDYVLALFGFKIVPKTRFVKMINIIIRIFGLLMYYATIFTFATANESHDDLLLSVWFVAKYVLLIVSHNVFWFKSQQFKQILEELNETTIRLKAVQQGTTVIKKRLIFGWTIATGCALLIAIYKSHSWVLYADNDVKVNSEMNTPDKVLTNVLYDTIVIHFSFGWIFATCIFYVFVCSCIRDLNNFLNDKYIKMLTNSDIEGDMISLLQELKWIRQDVQVVQDNLNKHFGVIPVVWLLMLALDVVWIVVTTDKVVLNYYMPTFAAMFLHDLIFALFSIGSLNFAIQVFTSETANNYHLLEFLKITDLDSHDLATEKTRMVNQLTERPTIRPKIFNVLPINLLTTLLFSAITVALSLLLRTLDHQQQPDMH